MIRLIDGRMAPESASARSLARGWLTLLWASLLALSSCDLADPAAISLSIESPVPFATFSDQDDVDYATKGLQIPVRVRTVGLGDGTMLELYRVRSGRPDGAIVLAPVRGSEATFEAFTLQPGANELQARIQDSERVSEAVSINFDNRCGSIEFVEPALLMPGVIRLGPGDDRDAQACGDTFTTRVVVSTGLPDGTELALLVNDTASRSAKTAGGVATFNDVVLGNRGPVANQLAVQLTDSECGVVDLAADVFVDCVGPSCALGGPSESELSSVQDKDRNNAGLQLDFDVTSNAEGQDVRLLINGDADNAKTTQSKKGTASFASVSLPEGKGVRVKAICSGENGATSSSERLFNVDTTGCSVAISEPSATEIFRAEQVSPDTQPSSSTSIDVLATVGSDCVSFRAIASDTPECVGIESVSPTRLKAGQSSIDTEVTLSAQGPQHLCVQVADSAGNTASTTVRVTFDKQTPLLAVTNPGSAIAINRAGTAGREADGNGATPACERPVSVSCSEAGAQVQIVTRPEGVVLATALCTAGVAAFASVPLPTQNDGGSYQIVARSTGANGLTGNSEPRLVTADCQAQTLSFENLACGVTNIRLSDDADLGKAGIQYDLQLENTPNPRPLVSLQIDGVAQPATSPTDANEGITRFDNVTFALNSAPRLKLCAVDAAGNNLCTEDCRVIVGDVPSVSITSPATGSLLTRDLSVSGVAYLNGAPPSSDCAPGTAGLQIEVRASVSANPPVPDGRVARVKLLSSADPGASEIANLNTTVAAGEVVGCINTADGDDLMLRVEVEHSTNTVFGVAARHVRIDGNAPPSSLVLTSEATACRQATLHFKEGADAPGALGAPRKLAGYVRRCAATPIVSEATWASAMPVTNTLSIDSGAQPLEYVWQVNTRPDRSRFCTVRGFDAAGALTPLVNGLALAAPALRERVIKLSCIDNGSTCVTMADGATDTEPNGTRITAVGDVNADSFDDVLVSGGKLAAEGAAALYLGSSKGLLNAPSARFVSSATLPDMGQAAAGIGDFNADGFDDFALSGPALRMVFVVFGRENSAWPTTPIVVDNGFCATDLCIGLDRDAGSALAAAGDFDLDGIADLAVATPSSVVSLVRGSTEFRVNDALGGSATGSCLDARAVRSGPNASLLCGPGTSASGFHLFTPAAPHEVQVLGSRVYITHRGSSTNAFVWAIEQRAYTQSAGMQPIGNSSDFSQLEVIHDLGSAGSSLFDRALSPIGDFDGDMRPDLAAGIDQTSGRIYVYPGQANGTVAFATTLPNTQVGYVFGNTQANNANDFFGEEIALGYHPLFGLLGDIDGDGLGDMLTSSRQDGASISSSDVFYGASDRSLARDRSSRSYAFDNGTLANDATVSGSYLRRAQYIGDVDGDGHQELALSEENFSEAGQHGRVIILGECKAP